VPFHTLINNVPPDPIGAPISVTASRATGANPLHVSSGALFGSPSPAAPIYVSVFRAGFPVTILEVTGNASNILTVTGAAPSSADAACNVGDTVMMCPTADSFLELQTGIQGITGAVASDSIATATALRLACWGDSLTAGWGGTPYPAQLSPLINRDCFNGGVGGDTSTQIKTVMLAATDKYNFAVVIWAGTNNFNAPSVVLADIAAMVAALGHTRYLVLSVLNTNVQTTGTPEYNEIIALNASLASAYGIHYFDIRAYLVSQYNPGIPQDVTDHGNDVVPSSLRSDLIHLNTPGYALVAQRVAALMPVLEPPRQYVVTTNMGALLAAPAGPIGSVQPTAGTFTNLTLTDATSPTTIPGRLIVNGGGATDTTVQMGTMAIQAFATNNCWIADNLYYDGGTVRYKANGYGLQLRMINGQFEVQTAPSGTAGAPATLTTTLTVDTLGNLTVAGYGPITTPKLTAAPSGGDYSIQAGTMGMQTFGAGNSFFADNLFFNGGAFTYKANGPAVMLYCLSGGFQVRLAASGTAGASATLATALLIDSSGNAGFVGNVSASFVSATQLGSGSGATGSRPTAAGVGARWYDTTLGRPIWWNGSVWKDAAGNTV
jgi:lysophospholipase L1-like esterase